MRTLLILAILAVVVMWALLVGGTIDDQPAIKPAPVVRAESVFDPPPVIVTTSSTTTSSTTTSTTTTPRARTAPTERAANGAELVFDRLADCESGSWDAHRNPKPHSADWASTSDGYEGGVHFTNDTWRGAGGGEFASHANLASRENQIVVAKRVLRRQGVRAWPVCGPKVGLTMADAA